MITVQSIAQRTVLIQSFGYKHTGAAPEKYAEIDCRSLPNPHNVLDLRPLDGRSPAVQNFLAKFPFQLKAIMSTAILAVQNGRNVAFGCHGGRHRSVACAEILAHALQDQGIKVKLRHTSLEAVVPSPAPV